MATKYEWSKVKEKQKDSVHNKSDHQNINLNLNNQKQECVETLQSNYTTKDSRKEQNYDNNLSTTFLNSNRNSEKNDEFKKSRSVNNSTLSIHIAAYENSTEATNNSSEEELVQSKGECSGLAKKWRTSNLFVDGPSSIIQTPELMAFRASQRLLNPNQTDANNQSQRSPPVLASKRMSRNSRTPRKKKSSPKTPAKRMYVVEKILDKRGNARTLEYLIKWKNYGHKDNTWEPAANCDCPDLIKKFQNEQKSKASGKKVRASDENDGPQSKRSRTAADTPRTTQPKRIRTPAVQRDSRSTSAGIIQLNRNRQNSVPTLVDQQVGSPSSTVDLASTSDEAQAETTHGENKETRSTSPTPSHANALSPPDTKPVLQTECNVVVAGEEEAPVLDKFQKKLEDVKKNTKMAQELVKCPDLFYVYVSLGILKENLLDDYKDLLAGIQHLNNERKNNADKLAQITAVVDEVKATQDDVENALERLNRQSRLEQLTSREEETLNAGEETQANGNQSPTRSSDRLEEQTSNPDQEIRETESEAPAVEETQEIERETPTLDETRDLENQTPAIENAVKIEPSSPKAYVHEVSTTIANDEEA
uniref:Chromo domain-containing protein n=1 Tax=Panagrolaimus sp. ES5 TaxID=591445 RepID=A0AC34F242_9BILA